MAARVTWTGASLASTVVKTSIPSNEDRYEATKSEVETARDSASGFATLNARLDSMDSAGTEVIAARDGYASLLLKEQAQDSAILAVTAANGSLISSNDTTPGFTRIKLPDSNTLAGTINNTGANETLSFELIPAGSKTALGIDYKTITISARALYACTTNGAASTQIEYGTNDIDLPVFAFDSATAERTQIIFTMPEDWDRSTVKAKFKWTNASGATAGDTVEWGVKTASWSNGDDIDTALTAAVVISDTLIGTDKIQITSATPSITIGGSPALGDLVLFEVFRNVSGTDDMTEDAYLVNVEIQYKVTNTVSAW